MRNTQQKENDKKTFSIRKRSMLEWKYDENSPTPTEYKYDNFFFYLGELRGIVVTIIAWRSKGRRF